MKNKIKIIISVTIFLLTIGVWNSLLAQEISPLGILAQKYIERLNEGIQTTNSFVSITDTVVVNPESVAQDAIAESIDTISKTTGEVTIEKERVLVEIKETVKQDIDDSIILIRKTTEKPAYELQRVVDGERTELFNNITETIQAVQPSEGSKIVDLQIQVDNSLQKIQTSLETESGLPVNFEKSSRDVRETLLNFGELLQEKKMIIESRQGALVFEDSDNDAVSDYDEIYIYKTDPGSARTMGTGDLTDGQKIQAGINALSDTNEKIIYQDPREDQESFVSSSYRVEKVQLIREENQPTKLVFEGVALPNTYITLYIYSTPIVVTVKTNDGGQWSYELEKELENGEHQMFVATVDTSGKILARSNPVLFTKSAEAAAIGIAGNFNNSISTQNFIKDNFILITLATLISIVVLGMMFVGNHKNIRSAVSELKNEVNTKY